MCSARGANRPRGGDLPAPRSFLRLASCGARRRLANALIIGLGKFNAFGNTLRSLRKRAFGALCSGRYAAQAKEGCLHFRPKVNNRPVANWGSPVYSTKPRQHGFSPRAPVIETLPHSSGVAMF